MGCGFFEEFVFPGCEEISNSTIRRAERMCLRELILNFSPPALYIIVVVPCLVKDLRLRMSNCNKWRFVGILVNDFASSSRTHAICCCVIVSLSDVSGSLLVIFGHPIPFVVGILEESFLGRLLVKVAEMQSLLHVLLISKICDDPTFCLSEVEEYKPLARRCDDHATNWYLLDPLRSLRHFLIIAHADGDGATRRSGRAIPRRLRQVMPRSRPVRLSTASGHRSPPLLCESEESSDRTDEPDTGAIQPIEPDGDSKRPEETFWVTSVVATLCIAPWWHHCAG